MSMLTKNMLGRCLFESTLKEIREIEKLDYSFITADDNFKAKIKDTLSYNDTTKKKSFAKKTAIIVVATLVICFSIIFAVSAQVRTVVVDFFVEVYEEFASFFIKKEDNTKSPITIETEYEATYFSDNNYKKLEKTNNRLSVITVWQRNNVSVDFSQCIIENTDITLDAESTSYKTAYIGEHKVYYTVKNNTYLVKWLAYEYSFNIRCKEAIGWDEIEKIVLSLEPVAKQ